MSRSPLGRLNGMSTPIVTETQIRSEPVARDTFIDDIRRAAGSRLTSDRIVT
jgi:hypothetical protein